jgi:hypothetical protein
MANNYASLQGKIYLGRLNSDGTRKGAWFVGNCPAGSIALSREKTDHKESTSGQRLLDKTTVTLKKAAIKLTLEEIILKNLVAALGADDAVSASGSYSGANYDTFGSGLAVGDIVKTKQHNLTSIVVKDSAGSPATLVNNTDYQILDAAHGLIQILNLGSYTQPFRAQYAYAATELAPFFTASDAREHYLYCALQNTERDPYQPIGVEIYRINLDPLAELPLINDEIGKLELTGDCYRDETKAADAQFGGFGRYIFVGANQ